MQICINYFVKSVIFNFNIFVPFVFNYIYFYIYLFLHFYIYLFLCPYVNKVGGPKLSQCRIGQLDKPVRTVSVMNEHEPAISLVSLLTLLTAVKPAAS